MKLTLNCLKIPVSSPDCSLLKPVSQIICSLWLRLVWQEKDAFKEASSPRNWCFRSGEEAADPDGCVYLCVTASVSCGVEVKRDDKQKPQLRKKERQSTDKRNIGIIFVLHLFLVSPSLSASVSTSD